MQRECLEESKLLRPTLHKSTSQPRVDVGVEMKWNSVLVQIVVFIAVQLHSVHALHVSRASGLHLSRVPLPSHAGAANELLSMFSDEFELSIGIHSIKSVSAETLEPQKGGHESKEILLQDTGTGWGTGQHPTTLLCLNFLKDHLEAGDRLLDYGAGSGILSIYAVKALGAAGAVAVDIDEPTLLALERNCELNGVDDKIDVTHTRMVYVGEDRFPQSDICVADILPGPLTRLVSPIMGFLRPGGWLCLSGMRRHELPSVRAFYEKYVEEDSETITAITDETFGEWIAWSAKVKSSTDEMIKELSQMAME